MKTNIIIPTGFYGTGSSAITDLLSEFDSIITKGDFEIRILHDPFGISDLYYNLVENPNRHNSGYALKRFLYLGKMLRGNFILKRYDYYFNYEFYNCFKRFCSDLTISEYRGHFHQEINDLPLIIRFPYKVFNRVLQATFWRGQERGLKFSFLNITYLVDETHNTFLTKTHYFLECLFSSIVESPKQLVIDQFFPPSNIARFNMFFPNNKVILVDRDPRDLFILEKYYWKGSIIPVDNVEKFCKWFLITRKNRSLDASLNNVLLIQFEDLIYHYDKSIDIITSFLEVDIKSHIRKRNGFNPEISVHNTKLWFKFKNEKTEIEYIENRLKEYLYEF